MTQQVQEKSVEELNEDVETLTLKTQGLLDSLSEKENKIADLRVQLTKLNNAYQRVSQEFSNLSQAAEARKAVDVQAQPQEQVYTPEYLPNS